MGQHERGKRIDATEDVPILHRLDVQSVLPAKKDDDFNAIEGIQSHPAVAEEVPVIVDVFRPELFQGEILHEELFEFSLDLVERSDFHGFQGGAILSTDDGREFRRASAIPQGESEFHPQPRGQPVS